MTLLSGFIPIIIFAVLIEAFGSRFHREVDGTIRRLSAEEWRQTEKVLRTAAEDTIRQKAVDAALQAELYLKAFPGKTLKDLKRATDFREIAVQHVGRTGYTAIDEVPSAITRFHHDPAMEDKDLHRLAVDLPQFWAIVDSSLAGKRASGYYDWLEPDGSHRQKYLYIVPLSRKTADGVSLNVVATAYVDEFTRPIQAVHDIRGHADYNLRTVVDRLTRSFMVKGLVLMGIGTLLIATLACWIGVYFSRAVARLKEATREVNQGNFNTAVLPSITGDVGELIDDFNKMVARLDATTVSKRLLEESENKFRTLAETTASGILIYRDDFFVYGNPAASRITGFSPEELAGLRYWEIAAPGV